MLRPRAARVAALIREQLGVEVEIERGGFGEFSVQDAGRDIIRRTTVMLPADETILEAVRAHLEAPA